VTPPVVPVVNPIGSGDCLAAGMAVGLVRGQPPLEALRHGVAAAADNACRLLPARLDRRQIARLSASIAIDKV
jgi:fructose-1-phosphate kinase PfkB-like protein